MTRAYLGLGSNLGDRRAQLQTAWNLLCRRPQGSQFQRSSLYQTPPWGKEDQPSFYNGVVALEYDGSPQQLLTACLDLEQALGRVRCERWGPRTLDVDVLLFDQWLCCSRRLQLPHPYLAQRDFVLTPLAELAPAEMWVPGQGFLGELWRACPRQRLIPIAGPAAW